MRCTKNALYQTWDCSLQDYPLWYNNGNIYYTREDCPQGRASIEKGQIYWCLIHSSSVE